MRGRSVPSLGRSVLFLLIAGTGLAAGCAETTREEEVSRVLTVDGSFADLLDRHRLLIARKEAYERELDLKRLMADQAITQLRQDVAATELEIRRKQAKLSEGLEPEYSNLQTDLEATEHELKQRKLERSQVGRELARIQKMQNAPDAELAELRRDSRRLELEITGFTAHRELVKRKLKLLVL